MTTPESKPFFPTQVMLQIYLLLRWGIGNFPPFASV
jgi:hypothetical protein